MEKRSYFTNNQSKGFVLPYVLFLVVILITMVTSYTKMYKTDVYLTDYYLEHLRVETLFQMGQMRFNEEILYSPDPLPQVTNYEFPDGTVTIKVEKNYDQFYEIVYIINTKRLSFQYNFYTRYYKD